MRDLLVSLVFAKYSSSRDDKFLALISPKNSAPISLSLRFKEKIWSYFMSRSCLMKVTSVIMLPATLRKETKDELDSNIPSTKA